MSSTDQPNIIESVYRYAEFLDNKNWTGMAKLLDDEIDMDFKDLTGNDPARIPSKAFTDFASGALDGIKTQHIIANPRVHANGQEATCVADHQSMHQREIGGQSTFFNLHGGYEFGLKKRGGDWRISKIKQTLSFTVGDQRVMNPNAR